MNRSDLVNIIKEEHQLILEEYEDLAGKVKDVDALHKIISKYESASKSDINKYGKTFWKDLFVWTESRYRSGHSMRYTILRNMIKAYFGVK